MPDDRICGLNAVSAVFAKRPGDVNRLYYSDMLKEAAGPLCAQLAQMRRPYRLLPDDEMQKAAGTVHHGGICALTLPRDVPMMEWATPPKHKLLLILDGIGNPHNLGAIARSAAFFGAGGLLLHDVPGAAMPSDAAYRVAEGAMEHLEIMLTKNLRNALLALDRHYRTVAASLAHDAVPVQSLPRDRPVALVLGNEERGLSYEATQNCRRHVRIVGHGPGVAGTGGVQSLNVAQAAAVLLFALS
jgi:TrmH RNA methyltransferase